MWQRSLRILCDLDQSGCIYLYPLWHTRARSCVLFFGSAKPRWPSDRKTIALSSIVNNLRIIYEQRLDNLHTDMYELQIRHGTDSGIRIQDSGLKYTDYLQSPVKRIRGWLLTWPECQPQRRCSSHRALHNNQVMNSTWRGQPWFAWEMRTRGIINCNNKVGHGDCGEEVVSFSRWSCLDKKYRYTTVMGWGIYEKYFLGVKAWCSTVQHVVQ